jgi:hypothetical protein
MSRPDFLSPIIMQDAVHFTDSIGSAQPRSIRLLNPNRCAMLVDEFRFYPSIREGTESLIDLDDVFCNIKLGSIPLTDDFVPVYGMALNYNLQASGQMFVDDWFVSGIEAGYTYRLPKPLYVPPDVPLEIMLRKVANALVVNTSSYDVMVVVAGRSMPEGMPKPDTIYVPWTSSFSVDPNYTPAGTFTDAEPMVVASPTNRLGNPHGEDLFLTKLTGPYLVYRHPEGTTQNNFFPERAVTIQATLSNGKIVIRDKIPYWDVFPLTKPWIDMKAVLAPKSFIKVQLNADSNFWETGVGGAGIYTSVTPTSNSTRLRPIRLCVQGYRILERPWGAMP